MFLFKQHITTAPLAINKHPSLPPILSPRSARDPVTTPTRKSVTFGPEVTHIYTYTCGGECQFSTSKKKILWEHARTHRWQRPPNNLTTKNESGSNSRRGVKRKRLPPKDLGKDESLDLDHRRQRSSGGVRAHLPESPHTQPPEPPGTANHGLESPSLRPVDPPRPAPGPHRRSARLAASRASMTLGHPDLGLDPQ